MLFSEFIFKEQTIKLKVEVKDWKDAIKLGTDMLEEKGFITHAYYEDIIKQAESIGPYFVLAEGLAMPHTRPEHGVNESSWALVTLEKGVEFGAEGLDPIDILVTMASKSSKEQNESAIVQVVQIFDTPELVDAIRSVKSIEDLKHAFDTIKINEED